MLNVKWFLKENEFNKRVTYGRNQNICVQEEVMKFRWQSMETDIAYFVGTLVLSRTMI